MNQLDLMETLLARIIEQDGYQEMADGAEQMLEAARPIVTRLTDALIGLLLEVEPDNPCGCDPHIGDCAWHRAASLVAAELAEKLAQQQTAVSEVVVENKVKEPGICAYCEEQSDRLFEPPLLKPGDWREIEDRGGSGVWWHVPGQAFGGRDLFHEIYAGEERYLRPYETPDDPICWECFDGALWPAAAKHCVNKPAQINFNGYRAPEWVE